MQPATGASGMREALGQSEVFLAFQEHLSKIAPVNRPVLIIGERGTGKELAATRLHYLSKRWGEPFVTLNCSALAPSLIETELFGHEKGAFTGAAQQRTGRFEAADGGTFFLDEIGNIPLEAQEKILRVVEYGSFERVGSSRSIDVDVRIIAATNVDLTEKAAKGAFMRDLLDRLSFEALFVPPLRMRGGDIPLLAEHFARRMAGELGLAAPPRFSKAVMALLERHPWPGNIRELKNVVERAVYRSSDGRVDHVDFEPLRSPYAPLPSGATPVPHPEQAPEAAFPTTVPPDALPLGAVPLRDAVAQLEKDMIEAALEQTHYHQKKAAALLGLTYDQFRGVKRKHADRLRHDRRI